MNQLTGKITSIEESGSLSLVELQVTKNVLFKAIVIETPGTADYLKLGNSIKLLFKETEVVIGSNMEHTISLQNRIQCVIESVEKGRLISKVVMNTEAGIITSIISSNAIYQLGLKKQMDVIAMVKLNEIMLSE